MTDRIFRAIFATATAVLVLSLGVVLGVLYGHYSQLQWERLESELALVELGLETGGEAYLQSVASENTRFTWIDGDGAVLFDTQASANAMDNHAQREEVAQALAGGHGTSQRYSNTLTTIMLYSATRLEDGTVLRIAAAQDSVFTLLLDALVPLLAVFVAAVMASAALAKTLAKKIVGPLNSLNLDAPTQADAYEELSPLLHRIDSQNKQVSAQIAQLQEKTDQFEQTTASMNEGLVLLDANGKVASINPAATKLFETSGSCVGLDFLAIDRSTAMLKGVRQAMEGQRTEFCATKQGREYQIDISPIASGDKPLGAVVLAFDITEQVNAQRNRQEFTANVSHELKTPLQSILNSAQLLQSGLVQPQDHERFTGYICTEAERMLCLINDVIRLSQLDEGGTFAQERVDLHAVCSQVLQSLLPAADQRDVSVELLGSSTIVAAVHRLVYELVYNLCDNAIRYNNRGGTVTVTVGQGCVTVKDSGIGIPIEHQTRIFERFYRVDKSHSRETGGTGLGLSIVKHAAQQLGARIELQSEPGVGTEVRVVFQEEQA